MAMNFDPMTGEPINPAPTPEQPQMRFDPMTGQPINPTPVQPQMAFDPMTGMPLQQPPKKKKKTGLIAGIVAGVVVIAGAGTVFIDRCFFHFSDKSASSSEKPPYR